MGTCVPERRGGAATGESRVYITHSMDPRPAMPTSGYLRRRKVSITHHIALQQRAYKLAILAFGRGLHLTIKEKVVKYVKRRMLERAEHTECGHVFQKGEVERLLENLASILLVPWTQDLQRQLQDIYGDERSPSLTLGFHVPLTTILPNIAEPFELPLMLYKFHGRRTYSTPAPQRRTTSSSLPHLPSPHLALPLRARLSSRRRSTKPTSISHSTPQDGY